MGDVLKYTGSTRLDLPCDQVINGVETEDLESVLVIGLDKKGNLVVHSNKADKAKILYLMELFKHAILSGHY